MLYFRFLLIILFSFILVTCDEPTEEDNEPPTVTITSPQNGSTVSEIVIVTCISTDNEGVEKVELWIDDSTTGIIDETEPYSMEWNTSTYEDGSHTIIVRSYDTSGNTTDSDPITLDVINIIQCDSGYVEIDGSCYWEGDIQFLQILVDSSGLGIDPLELGYPVWEDGRIIQFSCYQCYPGEIPPEIGNLSNLEWLSLANLQLSGEIPPEIGNLSNLTHLYLYSNQLNGEIPPEIGNLSNLEYLDLSWNQLTGVIPPEIGNLSNLISLKLNQNQLNGRIPPEIGNLSNLYNLNLGGNQLSGEIPPGIWNLSNLTSLYFNSNQLNGEIPPEVGNLSNLEILSLGGTILSGEIPPEIGNLSNLKQLSLMYNQLSGAIPSEIGNLSNLEWLWLMNNQLSGIIPEIMCDLNIDWDSWFFNITDNNFCPPYPECIEEYIGDQDTTGCE